MSGPGGQGDDDGPALLDDEWAQVRLAAIDDDTLIREGVSVLLEGVQVVAAYDRVESFLADRPVVDVVLLDLWLAQDRTVDVLLTAGGGAVGPDSVQIQGVKAVAAVANIGYRVLIYTNERRREVLAGCLAAGACGIVHKGEPLSAVVAAVVAVAGGRVVITTALAGLAEVVQRRGDLPTLSPRQLEVLHARARGETYRSIGARLFIAPKTAEEYMAEVNRRFADFLADHSPADLERMLGIGPGDLLAP